LSEIDLRSAGLILPAPEMSRSMTNFGMLFPFASGLLGW
jgi:hypothetical protein